MPYPASVKPLLDDLLFSLAFARSWGTKPIAPCPDLVGLDAFAARIGSHELVRNRTESTIGREKRQGKDKCLCRTREEGDEIAPVHLLRSQIRIDQ